MSEDRDAPFEEQEHGTSALPQQGASAPAEFPAGEAIAGGLSAGWTAVGV